MDVLPPLRPFSIPGPAGRLEGRLELPREDPRFLAVFGHPHPQFGGTMQNSVVVHVARVLAGLGGVVARFDFRGVGRSEGRYGEGAGELADFLAVVDWLKTGHPGVGPLLAAGFSFGSIRALDAAAQGRADLYLGIAPPLPRLPDPSPRIECAAALVLAGADELVATPTQEELRRCFADLRTVEVVPGARHLFTGKIPELELAVGRAARSLFAGAS